MGFVFAAETAATASSGSINRAWVATFIMAAAVLAAVWWFFPNAQKLIVGKDGRVSTSKFQVILWTFAVVFALLSLFFAFVIPQLFGDLFGWSWAEHLRGPIGESFNNFLDDGLDETYLLLLGFPLAAAVSSKAITTNKVSNGDVVKTPKASTDQTSSVQELAGDDQGDTDLGDFQYLLFNLLAVAYFLVLFAAHPAAGLPDMPDTLVGLTGVAAAAYVGKKGVYREPPILLGVMPPSAKPGATIDVYGQRLLSAPNAGETAAANPSPPPANLPGAMVLINGLVAPVSGEMTDSKLTATVPKIKAGAVTLKVLRPPGASSEELPFTVLDE